MKKRVILLLVLVCRCYSQGPIAINEDQSVGSLVANFTCETGTGSIEPHGIKADYFFTNSSGSETFIYLNRSINLRSGTDFPFLDPSACLKQVNLGDMKLTFKCKNQTRETTSLIIIPKRGAEPHICDTACEQMNETYELRIPEKTTVGSTVMNFTLCSTDINAKPSSIALQISGDILAENNKIRVYLNKEVDHENQPSELNSTMSINGKVAVNIKIIIEDSDDLGIAFTKSFFNCSVPENENGTVQGCVVTAKDLDTGINVKINYELLSVTPADGCLSLLPNGSLMLNKALDREMTSVYYLSIKGFQIDRPHDRINYTTMLVTVTDKDDNSPEMNQTHYDVSVMENSPVGTIVCQVLATDKDEGENAEMVYKIVGNSDLFKVESQTGLVKVKSLIDRESTGDGPIPLKIEVSPPNNPKKYSSTSNVSVIILDENDNSPNFGKDNLTVSINKTQALSVTIAQANATDPDKDENGKVSHHIDNSISPFTIDSTDGTITLAKSLNESFEGTYHIFVKATDQCVDENNRRSSVMKLTIYVSDVNIHTPCFFPELPTNISISEDSLDGTTLVELKAVDKDPSDNVSFSLSEDKGKFIIEDNLLKTNGDLDREETKSYTLVLSVTDTVHSSSSTIRVDIMDVNDNSPSFGQSSYQFNVTEESENAEVGIVTATDDDSGENSYIAYYIDPVSVWFKHFTVNSKTGDITTKGKIDRELFDTGNDIYFFVYAVDHGEPPRQNTTYVKINVIDINDHIPQFVKSLHNTFSVKEDTPLNKTSALFQVSAVDPDFGSNGVVVYSILPGNQSVDELFRIDNRSGIISMKKIPTIKDCDHRMYTIEITACNPNVDEGKCNTTEVICYIKDVNNQQPKFLYSGSINYTEHTATGEIKLCFNEKSLLKENNTCNYSKVATDSDCLPEYNTLHYWMDNDDSRFQIDTSTGIISIKNGSVIDYDEPQRDTQFNFTIYASDTKSTTSAVLTLNILDHQDSLPHFVSDVYSCSLKESLTPIGLFNCSLKTTNTKDIQIHRFSYTVEGGDPYFSYEHINDGKEIEINLNKSLDYETLSEKVFQLNITAEGRKGSTSHARVVISVENVNDEKPVFEHKDYNFTIAENLKEGFILGKINASDDDNLDKLIYTLNNEYLTFADGLLKLKKEPDLDNGNLTSPITDIISVNDGLHIVNATITVDIKPVNEYRPIFVNIPVISVKENEKAERKILATDSDYGEDGEIRYNATIPLKWRDNVTLNNDNINIIGFDREVMGSSDLVQLTIEAVDGGTPERTGMAVVIINVTGVNDNTPLFHPEDKNITIYLKEGSKYDDIHTSKAFDADIGNGSIIYYRLSKGNETFTIDKNNGAISSKNKLLINKTNKGILTAEVEAFNIGYNNTDTQYIIVILQDINNKKPIFKEKTYNKTLNECTEPGTKILRVKATDADTTAQFNTVTYWLEEYNEIFYVDHSTGDLFLVGLLDCDPPHNITNYTFQIFATDDIKQKNKSIFTTVEVTVSNCNDNAPVFTEDFYKCEIRENETGEFNCSVKAFDLDGDALVYEIVQPSQNPNLRISSANGTMSVVIHFNFDAMDNKEVFLNVSASDKNYTRYVSVTVNIINVNDEAPKFSNEIYNFSIAESNRTKLIVGQISATDKDGELNKLQYSLKDSGVFGIGGDGYITTTGVLDYESHNEYNLTATVNDSKHVDTANIVIYILPVNEYPPVFTKNYTWNVTENMKEVTQQIQATDMDKGDDKPITYRAHIPTKWAEHISFDNVSGNLMLKQIDREALGNNSVIRITAEALDGGTPQRTGLTIISIVVQGVNDESPVYPTEARNVTLRFKEGKKYPNMYTSKAFDADIGKGSIISYRLVKGNETFSIDENSGIISTNDVLWIKGSNKGILKAEVEAFNAGSDKKDTQCITLILQDINNNKPVFKHNRYTKEVDECSGPGTKILRVNATDADTTAQFNTVTYWLEEYNKTFYVDHSTGDLFLIGPLDCDTPQNITNYTFQIYATDDVKMENNSIFTTVEVTVSNCNDNAPVFTEDIYECEIQENKIGEFNCSLQASDLDGDTLSYEIMKSPQTQNFNISSPNGLLSVVTPFDYDNMDTKEVLLNISASDKKYMSYATVIVTIVDENDERPVFEGVPYVFNITENMTIVPHLVGSVRVSDVDSSFNLSLNRTCSDTYNISVSENGDIIANRRFDYEDGTHSLHCEIMARDKLTEVVKQDLTINIIDVNDNAPVFANESSGVSITENASKGTSVIEVSASDADNSSIYNQVTYSIFGGNQMELFKINAKTGKVSTDQSLASHGGKNIVLIIAAEDNGTPPLVAYSRLKIHIKNENIHRPVFQQQSYVASVKEDNGTIKILQVFATDEDNDLLHYTVLNHTDIFHFNNNSLLAKDLDAEAFGSTDGWCYLTIQVSDGTYNDNATVNITVVDINDNAPHFSYNSGNFYNLTLNDTAVTGENVLNITAKDRDISNTGFTFILYGGEGDFEINYSNGQLKLMQAFGRNGKFYNMSVIVIDHGNPPKSSTAQVIIHVQATNQNWHFNSSFEFNFSENSKSEQASIAATSDITITYEIISDNSFDNHDIFNLNKSTGLLTVANEANLLNFEKQSKYELVVSACDSAVFQRKFTANVTINVLDVNETPNITKYDKQVFVQENTTAGTIISAVEAFDPDKNDILSFDLSDNQNFTIRNNGNISVKTNILEKGNYSLSITVKDKVGLTSSVTTYVIVPGVEFQTLVPDSVFENVSVPFLISNLTSEMYNMKLVYSISSFSYSGKFLVAKNGSLMLTEDLDREVTSIVNLHIQGRDVSHGILITDIKITVRVDDVNDCKPEFLSSSYTVTINDVVANETRIAYIEAVDRDADEANRNLTYNIIGNYTDIFSMDGNKLKLDNSARLKTQQYHLTVSVTDGIFENSTSVRVIVLDTNNHSPAFSNRTYKFSVTETNNTGHSVGTVSAHDKDNDNNRHGEITYALSGGNKDSVFEINSTTGDIKTVTAIDREDKDTYTLIVTATDHGNNPRKGTCTVLVSVLDVNDNHPEFKGAAFFNASVQENSPNETAVVIIPEINVTDKDMGTNGTEGIVYRLNESEPFCMNETRPTIFVCGDLDREKKDLYHLEVIALDSNGNNGSLDTSSTVTIYILDVNDETPQFTDVVYTFNVSENTDTVVNVGNVSATDKDSGGNKTLRYSIISGDDGRFYVDTFSGMIYAGGNIDRENQSTFTLNVSAFDGVNRNYTGVVINVTDVNDNPPVFEMITFQDSINVNVVEETKYGIIFNATAFDHDEIDSDNSKITYHFNFSDPDNGTDLFIINDDGGLNLTRPLDREKRDHYEVTITATDSGSPRLSSSLHVHVNVLDINDNRPEFCVDSRCDKHEADCSTVEKAPVSSVLILLGSKDLDFGENATVSYSIEKSNVSKYFRIDNETGVVSVADALVVNNLIQAGMPHSSDTADVQLSIVATDGGGLNTSLTLHVFVEPINDADVPVFKESPCKFNVNETNETGIAVGSCIATTNDTLSQMTYELISGYGIHSDVFIIDPKTGNITTQSALDREKTDRYVFAVQVRDGRIPERTAFSSVEITINDVNDNSPVFMNENITISVLENSTVFTHTNVTATDIDEGLNAEISYTLNTNTNDSIFINIDEKGKLTLNGTFDYEQKKRYEIIVTAMDKGIPPRTSSAEVHIVVIDVNDNSPEFENITDFYRLPENQPPSQIFTVYSTDEDSGWNGKVVYKLQNIEDVPFGIDPFNGTVYLQGKLDYESKTNYTLSIIAQDLGSPPQSTIKEVTIYVGDVYDYKLMFKKNIFDINITPTTPLNQSLLNLTVTVPQAYFSVKGKDSEYFNIENSTGNLFLVKPISAERQLYAIQVVAEDGHGQNASCTVIAHVMAHDVTFNTPEIKLHLMENLNETTVLVDLNTTEELSGNGAEYTILNVLPTGKDLFTVDRTTGVLRCNKPLDREEHAQYTILISAHASVTRRKREIPRPSSTIRIIVDVGDVNDNPPHFTSDQERAFGVPDNVRANYLVGKIQAEDRDTSDAGKLRYNVTGGRSDVFGVNMETGEIRTLVAIASTRSSNFYLSISVSDGNVLNKKATINVTIFVVPTKNQPSVLVNMAVGEFNNRIDAYRKNMSEILGVVIQFEKIEAHQEVDSDGVIHVDLSRTDLIFHGINRTSGLLVSNERMNELINSNLDELAQLFHQKQLVVSHVIIDVIADPSAISTTQILFICMAVFIFFGSLAALVVAQYSWTRYETERQETEKEAERIKEVELSTIRSRQSSKLSSMMAAAAVNPAFAETEFVTSNGQITTGMKDKPQYESQELRVNFEEEPLEALLNAQGLGNASQSVIDSGVGHTSVHSEENGLDRSSPTPGPSSDVVASGNTQLKQQALDVTPANGEVPVMTSSPRASRDSKPVENRIIITTGLEIQADERNSESKEVSDTNIEGTRTRGASFVLLDATGESETDDTVDDNVENVSKAKEESKDETNIGHKSEGSLITKATADSRDGLDDIMNTEPGTRSGDASIDGESAHDGDAIIEANDDTDIECTSF